MSAPAVSSPFRRFLRGLTNTGLLLLLPCQLTLLWVANLDRPVRLPDFAAEFIIARLAEQGFDLQARDLWLQPNLSIAADDLALGAHGIVGEILTAERAELALNLAALGLGQVDLTRLRLRSAKLWAPASLARAGEKRTLIEELSLDLSREGRWLIIHSAQARAGKLTFHLAGEIPAALLRPADRPAAMPTPLPPQLKENFQHAEEMLAVAERSGGAAIGITCTSNGDGGAALTAHALLGNDWIDDRLGLIQLRALELRAEAQIDRRGRIGRWQARGSAREVSAQGFSAQRVALQLEGTSAARLDAKGHLVLSGTQGLGLRVEHVELWAHPQAAGTELNFRLLSTRSLARGHCQVAADGSTQITIEHAILNAEEVSALPSVRQALETTDLGLDGELLLRDVSLSLAKGGTLTRLLGEATFSGFVGLGLSAQSISPAIALPLRTRFDYDPARKEMPLRLRDLRLASVTGEADCSLQAQGPFVLHLNGELAPAALDRILGGWWVSLWEMFVVRARPYAFIEVESHWGSLQSITRGHVLLEKFDFMGAPFRHVEVSVDANSQQTMIGLHRMEGGTTEADGSVEGSVAWDWSKPAALAGPVVKARGDLQPWIAARCAGKEFGEALQGLKLPPHHRFELEVTPGGKLPTIVTSLECDEAFTAWGVPGRRLRSSTETRDGHLRITAGLQLAGGEATLAMKGDPLHRTGIEVKLQGCDPAQLGKLIADLNGAKPTTPTEATPESPKPASLNLDFKGNLDLEHPRLIKGLGHYELNDPELQKVRLLGGLSAVLEALGIGSTTYELTKAQGSFGCLQGRAYFPDLVISGPQSRLILAGEIDLEQLSLNFEGDFSLPRAPGFNPLELLNLNRTLISLTKIKVNGPLSKLETSALPSLKDIIKYQKVSNLGKIPPAILE